MSSKSPNGIVFSNPAEERIARLIGEVSDHLGVESYLIGGYVRDKVLGRPTKDMDVLAIGDGIHLAKEVAKRLKKKKPTIYSRFGTAMLRIDEVEVEFVGARKESYRRDSRNPEVETGTLEDDQHRRDFTINAMAICINADRFNEFIDPFNGLLDIVKKVIRTPLDPDKTFSDDPLRMMRAIRFATQLEYKIEEETFEGIKRNAHRIDIISQERITTELNKIMLSEKPSIGWKLLKDSSLCSLIAPEMEVLHGVDYVNNKGHKDNFYHTLEVLDNVAKESEDLWLRYAALLHDIGKPRTKRYNEKVGWTFHGHDAVGSYMVPKIFRKWKLPLGGEMQYVKKLVLLHLRPISLTNKNITDSAVRRLLFEAGDDIEDLMTLCEADITTKNPRKMQRYLANYELVKGKMIEIEEADHLRNWQPPVSGEDIMNAFGIKPSRQVGVIKDAIREAILDGDIPNSQAAARQFMITKGKELGLTPVSS